MALGGWVGIFTAWHDYGVPGERNSAQSITGYKAAIIMMVLGVGVLLIDIHWQ